MNAVSVALIDANNLFREGLKALFADGEFHITKEATNLTDALQKMTTGEPPQLIVIDPSAADDPVQAVTILKSHFPEARLVMLTTRLDAGIMANAIHAGADGFLLKDLSLTALAQSLRLVMMGEKVLPSHLAALLISGRMETSPSSVAPTSQRGLSHREMQILQRLITGDSNKMIANTLGITEATVKVHLKSLLRKINASNRTQAAIWALNNGFTEGAGSNNMAAA